MWRTSCHGYHGCQMGSHAIKSGEFDTFLHQENFRIFNIRWNREFWTSDEMELNCQPTSRLFYLFNWYICYFDLICTQSGDTTSVAGVILPLLNSLLYSRKSLLYSVLYSETHYSTEEVAGVTKIWSWKESQKLNNLVAVTGHLGTPNLLCPTHLLN